MVFFAIVAFHAWDRYDESREAGPEIEDDIEEKQRRQDELLLKTFPHM